MMLTQKTIPFLLWISFAIGLSFLPVFILQSAHSAPPDYTISIDEVVASGLQNPVKITHAGDQTSRLFVLEQPGRIRIIKNNSLLPTPFLDITSLVLFGGERGLLGLAFHPQYEQNGYFYVNYTRKTDGATVIARYTVSDNPDIANPTNPLILFIIPQPYSNHNGGDLHFGPDGYLYIGMGDGGSGGDPQNYAQNKNSLLGKLLRVDVDSATPYAIPPTNPYVGLDGLDEIWALGLRNPWRFSFDRLTGDLYLGDVGQNLWEEVDYIPANNPGGVNLGWRCREGSHPYSSSPPCNDPQFLATLTDPITEYDHTEGASITGGYVYRGSRYPSLYGTYFFGDFVSGKIWSIKKLSSSPLTWSARTLEQQTGFNVSAFGEGEDGELYVANYYGGKIHHLIDSSSPINIQEALRLSKKSPNTRWADPGETITYTIELSNTSTLPVNNLLLTDTLPSGLSYLPGSFISSSGTPNESSAPLLSWTGNVPPLSKVILKYNASVDAQAKGSLNNTAVLSQNSVFLMKLSASTFVPRPILTTSSTDFILPGTQPLQLTHALVDSTDCDTCHSAPIYDRWRGSMMSQSGRDPLMWAALAASNNFVPDSGELCIRCHAPAGWFAGRSQDVHGNSLTVLDIRNGVSCQLCHRMVDPSPPPGSSDQATPLDNLIRQNLTHPIPPGEIGSGMLILDPQDNRRGPFTLASTFGYHTAYQTNFQGQDSDAVTRARLCGSCHDIDNPILSWDASRNQYWFNAGVAQPAPKGTPFPIERTFSEWLNSAYASSAGVYAPQFAGSKTDKIVRACQDCHMPRTTGYAADEAFNPFLRDCSFNGCLPSHDLLGANTWIPKILLDTDWRLYAQGESNYLNTALAGTAAFLSKAATLQVTLEDQGGQKLARVTVINQTGHKLPTGYPEGRRIWIHLQAFDAAGQLVAEFGEMDSLSGEIAQDTKIYEVQQGLSPDLAGYLGLQPGHSFHFLLNNTVLKDNRIPPRGFTNSAFSADGLQPVGASYADGQYWDETEFLLPASATNVRAVLYYQAASTEYLQFLLENGGQDGQSLFNLSKKIPNSPQLMSLAWYPDYPLYLPIISR